MSGKPKPADATKPGKSAAKPATGSGTAPKSKPAAGTRTGASSAKSPATKPKDEDDPFEVDTSAVRKAIRLSPRPTKSRTYEIVCPMCETKGFLAPQDAGKDVQCANPECIVPVFKSKRPKVEAPPEEAPKSKKGLFIGVGVAVALIGGFAIYSMMTPKKDPVVIEIDPFQIPTGPAECDDCPVINTCDQCEDKQVTLPDIREGLLAVVMDAAREKGSHNRNDAIRIAVETFAISGQINQAQQELKRLQSAGQATAYLQLQPLAEIAWRALANGNVDSATEFATNAQERAKNLPPTVRRSLDSVTSVAAVLAAAGKSDAAIQLIQDQISEAEYMLGSRGDASVLWRAAFDSQTYDVGLEASRPYHVIMPESLRMGVIETLVAHGYADEAWTLIDSARKVDSQDACRAAWAGRLAEMKPETVMASIAEAMPEDSVSAIGRTRVWAAVAAHLSVKQQNAAAQTAFTNALAAAANMAAPNPEPTPTMKQIYESNGKAFLGLSDPATEESAALACSDLALVAVQLGQTDQAIDAMQKSMAYARATTPGPVFTQELVEECEKRENYVKSQLQSTINLGSSAPEVRAAFNRYRLQCTRLNEMAQKRLQFQVQILRALAKAQLLRPVWDFTLAQDGLTDANAREPFLETTLPGFLLTQADLAKNEELRKEISTAKGKPPQVDPIDLGIWEAERRFQLGNFKDAAGVLRTFYRSAAVKDSRDRADIAVLGMIADMQQTQPIRDTFDFLVTISDPVLKQDGFQQFSAYTVKSGQAPELWELLQTPAIRQLGAIEKTSIYRGLATGIAKSRTTTPQAATGAE